MEPAEQEGGGPAIAHVMSEINTAAPPPNETRFAQANKTGEQTNKKLGNLITHCLEKSLACNYTYEKKSPTKRGVIKRVIKKWDYTIIAPFFLFRQ